MPNFWCLIKSQRRSAISRAAILFASLLLSLSMLHAQTLRYKVLLIGNDSYVNFPVLEGAPIKDVNAMYQVLIGLGLAENDVTVVKDIGYSEFLTTLIDFRAKLSTDDAVLFYYSGHGFSIDGVDYLAPVDFWLGETKDIARNKSIGVAQVVAYLATTKSRVIVLDACRTEAPLLKELAKNAPKAPLDPLISTRSACSLIAYSTSAQKASNARSPSGLSFYTQYLVNSLAARPKDMYTALYNAKLETSAASSGKQVPAIYDEMEGSFVFLSGKIPGPDLGSLTVVRRSNWMPVHGSWQFSDGSATQTEEDAHPGLAVVLGSENATELTFDVRRISGDDGFSVIVSYEHENLAAWWDVGGYGGTKSIVAFSVPDGGVLNMPQTDRPFAIETGHWYAIHIERKGSRVLGTVNGGLLLDINIPDRIGLKGKLGFRTWSSRVEFRNVYVR